MSSLRNAIPRREHKERHQPNHRKNKGLLEKKKDYIVRAKEWHLKDNTLKKLKLEASFRNKDEFYHKMIRTKRIDGVHQAEDTSVKYTKQQLLDMKGQDMNYILLKKTSSQRKLPKFKKIYILLMNLCQRIESTLFLWIMKTKSNLFPRPPTLTQPKTWSDGPLTGHSAVSSLAVAS